MPNHEQVNAPFSTVPLAINGRLLLHSNKQSRMVRGIRDSFLCFSCIKKEGRHAGRCRERARKDGLAAGRLEGGREYDEVGSDDVREGASGYVGREGVLREGTSEEGTEPAGTERGRE